MSAWHRLAWRLADMNQIITHTINWVHLIRLIFCRPLLPPSIFLSIRVFSNESVLRIRLPKYWSFSFSISPSNEYSGLNCPNALKKKHRNPSNCITGMMGRLIYARNWGKVSRKWLLSSWWSAFGEQIQIYVENISIICYNLCFI